MDEIDNILRRYDESYISENLKTLEDLNRFAIVFFKDVAEIYDCITRVKI